MKKWITLDVSPYEGYRLLIKEKLIDTKTKFQKVTLYDTYSFKKCLFLDGDLQSSELDEFIYHEALVHPALLSHPNPENVLILGGGEGSTLREVLKHKSVKKVVMVDIDGEVVEFCKKHLQSFHQNAFDDNRAKIVIGDAKDFIEKTNQKFDIIISDLCCPIEGTPAAMLYTKEFYTTLIKRLSDKGVFVLQSGPGDIPELAMHSAIYATLKTVFPNVEPFYASIPSFLTQWAFIIATKNKEQSIKGLSSKKIDSLLKSKILKNKDLKYYDGITHQNIFSIPKHIRKILDEQKTIITEDKPYYLF